MNYKNDFATLVMNSEAITESGKNFLNRYKNYCYNNAVNHAVVNAFVNEARQYGFDKNIQALACSINSRINENKTSWALASVCESINANNSVYNNMNRRGVEIVEKALEGKSEREVVESIKAGELQGATFIPQVNAICKSVFNNTINENYVTSNFRAFTPISFVQLNEDGSREFNVYGVTFNVSESGIQITTNHEKLFNDVNYLIAEMNVNDDVLEYTTNVGNRNVTFKINENSIEMVDNTVSTSFENIDSFAEAIENRSKKAIMNVTESYKLQNAASAVTKVFENMSNIYKLDNVKLFNGNYNQIVAVIENNGEYNVTLFNGFGHINETNSYETLDEMLTDVRVNYGMDIKEVMNTQALSLCESSSKGPDILMDEDYFYDELYHLVVTIPGDNNLKMVDEDILFMCQEIGLCKDKGDFKISHELYDQIVSEAYEFRKIIRRSLKLEQQMDSTRHFNALMKKINDTKAEAQQVSNKLYKMLVKLRDKYVKNIIR